MSVPPSPQWSYQPPQQSKGMPGWAWALISIGGSLVVVLIGLFVAWWWFFAGYYGDYSGMEDFEDTTYYYVEQDEVLDAIDEPCQQLDDAVEDVQPFGPDAGAQLADLAVAVRAVADSLDAVDDLDDMSAEFRDDWTALATELEEYSDAVAAGDADARFEMPEGRGIPVSVRIYDGNDSCYVPTVVSALDPDSLEMYYGYGY